MRINLRAGERSSTSSSIQKLIECQLLSPCCIYRVLFPIPCSSWILRSIDRLLEHHFTHCFIPLFIRHPAAHLDFRELSVHIPLLSMLYICAQDTWFIMIHEALLPKKNQMYCVYRWHHAEITSQQGFRVKCCCCCFSSVSSFIY